MTDRKLIELDQALAAANEACAGKEPDDVAYDRRQEIEGEIAATPAASVAGVAIKLALADRSLW